MHNIILKEKTTLIATFLWACFICFIVFRITESGFSSVSTIYYNSSINFINKRPLYDMSGWGFIYFPTTPALLLPFTLLSKFYFEIAYRVISTIIFVYGCVSISKLFAPTRSKQAFMTVSILCIPLAISSADIGQLHFLIIGLLMVAYYDIYKSNLLRASFLISMSIALKPIFIPIYLLSISLFPQIRAKTLLWTISLFLLPFMALDYNYVINQYISCIKSLHAGFASDIEKNNMWSQFFGVYSTFFNIQLSIFTQFVIRTFAAGATILICYLNMKVLPYDKRKYLINILATGVIYTLLFNPRTENNNYIMIIPFIGIYLYQAIFKKQWGRTFVLLLFFILNCLNHDFSTLITQNNNHWIKPCVAIFFLVYLIHDLFHHEKLNKKDIKEDNIKTPSR